MNEFWIRVISIVTLCAAFLLSPLLFPDAPEITKYLMYAWFASMGLGMGIPAISNEIKKIRGVK